MKIGVHEVVALEGICEKYAEMKGLKEDRLWLLQTRLQTNDERRRTDNSHNSCYPYNKTCIKAQYN